MDALAVVFEAPKQLALRRLTLAEPTADQVAIEVEWSGISTGTERLLWSGEMPPFPGLGYPLVPGYESVGRVVGGTPSGSLKLGDRVFVPGASCFGAVRGLFGGAASHLIVQSNRVKRLSDSLDEEGVLLALAATAQHALAGTNGQLAELIIGHGVLGRLLARITVAAGGSPVVWETNPRRAAGGFFYPVINPKDDPRRDYRSIYDASGDASLIESLIGRLARGGELVLAGFYSEPISFAFPPAFMKEARIRVAAEWEPKDLDVVTALVETGRLPLNGLITHRQPFEQAIDAYATAFTDSSCLKMILDWRVCQ